MSRSDSIERVRRKATLKKSEPNNVKTMHFHPRPRGKCPRNIYWPRDFAAAVRFLYVDRLWSTMENGRKIVI